MVVDCVQDNSILRTWKTHQSYSTLGPNDVKNRRATFIHTQAKSRDHVIVRAQKKVSSQGRPNTPLRSSSVVTNPQV